MNAYSATKCGQIIGRRGGPLRLIPKANGYLHFSQSQGFGNPQQTLVHRFVWEFWLGAIPKGLVIDHIDGDRHNNRLNNLRVVTQAVNARSGGAAKLTAEQVEHIRVRRTAGERGASLAREFNVSPQLVCDILKGRV